MKIRIWIQVVKNHSVGFILLTIFLIDGLFSKFMSENDIIKKALDNVVGEEIKDQIGYYILIYFANLLFLLIVLLLITIILGVVIYIIEEYKEAKYYIEKEENGRDKL